MSGRHRGRGLLVAVLVVIGLLVGADRLAAVVTSRVIASRLASAGLADPSVRVVGFPILPQLVAERLDQVTITAPSGSGDGLAVRDIRLDAVDLTRSGSTVRVGGLTGSALVGYAALAARAGLPAGSMGPGPEGLVSVRRSVSLLGASVVVVLQLRVTAAGQALDVQLAGADLAGVPLGAAVPDGLTGHLPVAGLPAGVTLSRVTAGPDGVTVGVAGHDLVLGG